MGKIKKPKITENEDLKKEFTYPEDLEFNTNRPLMIGIRGPYEFIVLEETTYIISTSYKERLMNGEKMDESDIYAQIADTSHMYNPFEQFDMEVFINTVLSLDVKDTKSIINFYNQYGTIGYDGIGTQKGSINESTARNFGMQLHTTNESLAYFRREIGTLQDMIRIHEALQNKDEDFLRTPDLLSKYTYPKNELTADTPKETVYLLAKRALLHAVNSKANLINPVVGLADGEITKFTSSTCLLGVFYLRLYELVTENPKIKKCRYCGDYFIPRKADANFCPPPEANERSKCANRYDAMVRRIAQWHFKEELTVEEIQKKLTKPKSRSIKEIKFILENYTGKLKK